MPPSSRSPNTRVAVLDDYQRRARSYADWESLGEDVLVEFFSEPIAQDELPERLVRLRRARADARANALRTRRVVTAARTSGSSSPPACATRRSTSPTSPNVASPSVALSSPAGSGPGCPSTVEVAWALILAVAKRVTQEDRALRAGRWQLDLPDQPGGRHAGPVRSGQPRRGHGRAGPRVRHGGDRLEPEPHRRARRRGRGAARLQGRTAVHRRFPLHPPRPLRPQPRPHRRS